MRAGGIGLGIASVLASHGANVMINGLGSQAEIKAAQDKLTKHNVRVAYNGANLINPNEVEELVKATVSQFGSVDILVNNAGSCIVPVHLRVTIIRRHPTRCTCWYQFLFRAPFALIQTPCRRVSRRHV